MNEPLAHNPFRNGPHRASWRPFGASQAEWVPSDKLTAEVRLDPGRDVAEGPQCDGQRTLGEVDDGPPSVRQAPHSLQQGPTADWRTAAGRPARTERRHSARG